VPGTADRPRADLSGLVDADLVVATAKE